MLRQQSSRSRVPAEYDRSHLGQVCSMRTIRPRASKRVSVWALRVSRKMQTTSLSLQPSGDSGSGSHEPRTTTAGLEVRRSASSPMALA
eukprot:14280267-Alexandrium_andersonii.AAC.1